VIALPIDPLLADIVSSLRREPNLVIEAPPGAGKTTRVPPALLDAGFGEVLVLEPRRLAARLAARRVAEERGEKPGGLVGYQVRFENCAGPETRLRFLTEGVLTRRLISDPDLDGVGAVVLDEFHERHLEGDLALALLLRLQRTRRPDLRLAVMSATLEGLPLAEALGGCPVIRSEGRLFEPSVEYTPHSPAPLEEQVAAAVERIVNVSSEGDILVFLPGSAEIRRAQRSCARLADRRNLLLLPLHGDLSPEEQDRAVTPAPQRKVILSTNVAESSITIEGVRAVVDSGLHRVAKDSPWSGLPRVEIARICRASAKQRAGRAARTAPGLCVRLYPEDDLLRRPEHDLPEISRRELSQLCLGLHAAGVRDPHELPWFDPPPEPALQAAEVLLRDLGALDAEGRITAFGRRLAALPLHPRLGALALRAGEYGAGDEGCAAAAALAAGERIPETPPHEAPSDLHILIERRLEGRARQVERQIRAILRPRRANPAPHALQLAALRAFPDRVARRRKGLELRLAGGASAQQAQNSAVPRAPLLVAIDVEERPDLGAPLVRIAAAIEPEWLLDLFPGRIREETALEWNRAAERVEQRSAILYGDIVLEESRGAPAAGAAAEMLASQAQSAGLHRFCDPDSVAALRARLDFASAYSDLPPLDDAAIAATLRSLCDGLASFAELERLTRDGGFERALLDSLGPAAAALDRIAPERIRLPSGRHAKVHYAAGQTPWVASRLQDFFGLRETPRIAGGKVPLVVHLLAPSQRPVQTTQDLAGFWARLYPQVRRELMRRYPKHAWPEDPYTASKGS
jgi:ATP-dependent helicase HrpB